MVFKSAHSYCTIYMTRIKSSATHVNSKGKTKRDTQMHIFWIHESKRLQCNCIMVHTRLSVVNNVKSKLPTNLFFSVTQEPTQRKSHIAVNIVKKSIQNKLSSQRTCSKSSQCDHKFMNQDNKQKLLETAMDIYGYLGHTRRGFEHNLIHSTPVCSIKTKKE